MNFLKGALLVAGFCLIVWLILEWNEDLCLEGGTYCEQKFCGYSEKIKACEQEAAERAKNASPEEKAKTKKVLDLLNK